MGEKLLTKSEAAQLLEVPEAELERLVADGLIEAYRLGGQYLRFRRDHLLQHRAQYGLGKATPTPTGSGLGRPRTRAATQTVVRRPAATHAPVPATWTDRVRDFFYFNDFYLIAAVLVAGLLIMLLR